MKKILAMLLSLTLALGCAIGLVGCANGGGNDGDGDGMTRAEYSALYKTVADDLFDKAGYDNPTATASVMSEVITDIPETTDESDISGLKNVMATMAAVLNMLGDYCANEDFVISDKPVTLTGHATVMGYTNTYVMTFLPKVDKENSMIYLDWYAEYEVIGLDGPDNIMLEYDYLEIGYDFNGENGITSFRLITKRGMTEADMVYDEERIDEQGKAYRLKELNDTFKGVVDGLKTAFMTKKADGIVLTEGNFDTEFQTYLDSVMAIMSGPM